MAERHEMELSKEKESNITADEKDKKQTTPLDVKVVVASKNKKVFTGKFLFSWKKLKHDAIMSSLLWMNFFMCMV